MAMLRREIETVFAVNWNSSGKHFNLRDVITDHGSDSEWASKNTSIKPSSWSPGALTNSLAQKLSRVLGFYGFT